VFVIAIGFSTVKIIIEETRVRKGKWETRIKNLHPGRCSGVGERGLGPWHPRQGVIERCLFSENSAVYKSISQTKFCQFATASFNCGQLQTPCSKMGYIEKHP